MADASRSGRPPKDTRADLDALEAMLDESAALGGPAWTLQRTRTSVRHKADEALQQIAKDQLEGLLPVRTRHNPLTPSFCQRRQ
ncbi:hypothetical protein [Streptomyces sp. SLBN-118]|uniref:hypothetical protein n=1 Tax=Streptomyces sp. SLBN-118 TaxID=2768454 RepID=UPI001642580F|nr:hypothetical protein [Streptomyces sp. SLBN-118]